MYEFLFGSLAISKKWVRNSYLLSIHSTTSSSVIKPFFFASNLSSVGVNVKLSVDDTIMSDLLDKNLVFRWVSSSEKPMFIQVSKGYKAKRR